MEKKEWVTKRAKELRDNQTKFEKKFANWIRKKYLNTPCAQFPIEVNGKYYILDFLFMSENIAVEIDGKQHSDNKEYDETRDSTLLDVKGIYTIRIENKHCNNDMLDKRFGEKLQLAYQVLKKNGIVAKELQPKKDIRIKTKSKKGIKRKKNKAKDKQNFSKKRVMYEISLNYWE